MTCSICARLPVSTVATVYHTRCGECQGVEVPGCHRRHRIRQIDPLQRLQTTIQTPSQPQHAATEHCAASSSSDEGFEVIRWVRGHMLCEIYAVINFRRPRCRCEKPQLAPIHAEGAAPGQIRLNASGPAGPRRSGRRTTPPRPLWAQGEVVHTPLQAVPARCSNTDLCNAAQQDPSPIKGARQIQKLPSDTTGPEASIRYQCKQVPS